MNSKVQRFCAKKTRAGKISFDQFHSTRTFECFTRSSYEDWFSRLGAARNDFCSEKILEKFAITTSNIQVC